MKVVTGQVRFMYCHVFEPQAHEDGGKEKYSVSILIPKSDTKTVKAVKDAIKTSLEDGKSTKFGGKIPRNYKNPLRDGDEEREDDENYHDHYFLTASTIHQPQIVDKALNVIIDADEFYSGCYGRASINFYAFNNQSKGVAVGLRGLQKLKDGERLGGVTFNAEEDFGDGFDSDDLM